MRTLSLWGGAKSSNAVPTPPPPPVSFEDELPRVVANGVDDVAMKAQQAAELSALSMIDGPNRVPSMLERMDGWWSRTFEAMGIPHFGFIDGTVAWLETVQAVTGLPWSLIVVSFGFLVRLITLPLSIYGERATLRLAKATQEVRPQFEEVQRLYGSGQASRLEIVRAGEELRAARAESFKKHETSNRATMMPLLGSPLLMIGFSAVLRVMDEAGKSVTADTGMLWLTGITSADPFGIVPICALALTVSNFEITYSRRRGASPNKTGMLAKIPWFVRGIAVASIPLLVHFRVGTMLYWFGLSLAGLIQPLLFGSKRFCTAARVPDLTVAADPIFSKQSMDAFIGVTEPQAPGTPEPAVKPVDTLEARFEQRFPRLSLYLRPGAALKAYDDNKQRSKSDGKRPPKS